MRCGIDRAPAVLTFRHGAGGRGLPMGRLIGWIETILRYLLAVVLALLGYPDWEPIESDTERRPSWKFALVCLALVGAIGWEIIS